MHLELLSFQKEICQILENTKKQDRLSHAYIFQGPNGVGKSEMAYFFACMLYSEVDVVDLNSTNSRLILTNEHVNVYVIKPDGKMIKKDQIQSLQQELSKTSQVKGPRIYIILDADKMNQTSQNSLLKFIEEPASGIYGVLCTTNISQILPTITSRCQTINFKALNDAVLISMLRKEGIDKNLSNILAILTKSFIKALEMAKDENILVLTALFEQYLKIRKPSDAMMFEVKNLVFFDNQTNLSNFLNLLIVLYEDMLILYQSSLAIHLDGYIEKINKLKENLTELKVRKNLELVYDLQKKLLTNVSPKNIAMNLFVNLF